MFFFIFFSIQFFFKILKNTLIQGISLDDFYRITAIAVDDLHNNVNKTDVGKHVIFAATGQ